MRLPLILAGITCMMAWSACEQKYPHQTQDETSELKADVTDSGGSSASGTLFIIGGGSRPDTLMERMVAHLPERKSPYLAIISNASSEPDTAFHYAKESFLPITEIPLIHFHLSPADVVNTARIDSLKQAAGIFLTGGDQSRLMQVLEGTPLGEAIRHAWKNGAVIGGTSAGAAVMSEVMITGDQHFSETYQPTYDKVWKDNGQYAQGLGLVKWAVVDQHFVARSRYNRLLSALADHPGKWGVGIDESTALLIRNGRAEVCGESQVVVMHPPKSTRQQFHHLGLEGIEMDVLLAGQTFQIPQP